MQNALYFFSLRICLSAIDKKFVKRELYRNTMKCRLFIVMPVYIYNVIFGKTVTNHQYWQNDNDYSTINIFIANVNLVGYFESNKVIYKKR